MAKGRTCLDTTNLSPSIVTADNQIETKCVTLYIFVAKVFYGRTVCQSVFIGNILTELHSFCVEGKQLNENLPSYGGRYEIQYPRLTEVSIFGNKM